MRVCLVIVVVLLSFQIASEAKTFRVPSEYNDLAAAIGEARYGDTVLVYPGKYKLQERLRSGVNLLSVKGPDSTVLWNRRWHIVRLVDCDIETVVSGFTFEGKACNICVACSSGAPVIADNTIRGSWDGINLQNSSPFIKGNTITACIRGVYMEYSNPELVENTIKDNGDGLFLFSSSPLIARCTIESNGNRGILILGHSYPVIGGMLSNANDFIDNGSNLYNEGFRIEGTAFTDQMEVAVATHNYWGSNCPPKTKFRGDVVYAPWTNAEHDTTFTECPKEPPSDSDTSR